MLHCELLYPYWYIVFAGASVSLAEINNNRLHDGYSGVRVHFHQCHILLLCAFLPLKMCFLFKLPVAIGSTRVDTVGV